MRRPDRAKPDINVTPLVDVVLVLLIIFMVIVPQMEAGASVNVPGARHPDTRNDPTHAPITVSITPSGGLFLEKTALGRERLLRELGQMHAAGPGRRLVLKGDHRARYDAVRSLFRDCQKLGFPGISLQVGDLRPGEEAN